MSEKDPLYRPERTDPVYAAQSDRLSAHGPVVDSPIDERLRQGLEALLPAPELSREDAAKLAQKIVQQTRHGQPTMYYREDGSLTKDYDDAYNQHL